MAFTTTSLWMKATTSMATTGQSFFSTCTRIFTFPKKDFWLNLVSSGLCTTQINTFTLLKSGPVYTVCISEIVQNWMKCFATQVPSLNSPGSTSNLWCPMIVQSEKGMNYLVCQLNGIILWSAEVMTKKKEQSQSSNGWRNFTKKKSIQRTFAFLLKTKKNRDYYNVTLNSWERSAKLVMN